MFDADVYSARRDALRKQMASGLLLFCGNRQSPINFPHNVHPFRQDSSFSYFFGMRSPDLAAVIDIEAGSETIYGNEAGDDDLLWFGQQDSLSAIAERVGIKRVKPLSALGEILAHAQSLGRKVHFLPPYQAQVTLALAKLLHLPPEAVVQAQSDELVRSVVALREIKAPCEIEQIEEALTVTRSMHLAAMQLSRPGVPERHVVAEMRRLLQCHGLQEAYASVFTKRKEGLHVQSYDLHLEKGDLVINDTGAASSLDYASDVTRTIPVDGRFDARQRELYEILLNAQLGGIAAMRPGTMFRDVHRQVSVDIVRGMTGLGFFRGKAEDVVDSGAYAICFPHGLGHQIGLDVHDMESLGEDNVGYDAEVSRSDLFGLSSLRMAKRLVAGMVLTVEPGIYFIPALIDRWRNQARFIDFICYRRFDEFKDFGGMRIEDVVGVLEQGSTVLGPEIPKTIAGVEATMHSISQPQ